MSMVTFVCPDELVLRIDAIVSERKKLPKYRMLTPDELKTMRSIARIQGIDASNEYARKLQAATRHSRTSVILEMITNGVNSLED